jgi:phosphoglycolate phosphatase-like HAD superfamily hydrolase
MRYDLIILDLDGTLADSFPFFTSVHNQLAERHGFRRIERVLKATRTPRERALYVGDQITDAEAAHAAGVAFCAVAWGYATPESLRAANPRHLLRNARELAAICDGG